MANIERPRVGVPVIVKKEDKLLIGLRTTKHAGGMWGFPGGHLEFGESFYDCARREVVEETGLTLGEIKFWRLENVVFPDEGLHYVTVFMVADWVDGEPQRVEPEKCAEWRWTTWENMPTPLMPGIVKLLEKGLNPFVPSKRLWIKDFAMRDS